MELAIVERLACPEPHVTTPLVVRADRIDNARLTAGLLGCPVCHSEWPVVSGVAQFGPRLDLPGADSPDVETVAALLGLTEPGIVIIDGAPLALIAALSSAYQATIIAFDTAPAGDVSVIDGAARAPLAPGMASGALLLRGARDVTFVESIARALTPRGRVLATKALQLSASLTEMTRDDRFWLAERSETTAPITLRRGAR